MVSQLCTCDTSRLMDAITKIHPTINKHIKFETLIQFLNHYNIFTAGEIQSFNNKNCSLVEKVNHLISWLDTKDHEGICNFVKALDEENEHSGHHVIVKKLHETLFPETTV